MINYKNNQRINESFLPLFKELRKKLNKSILISVSHHDKRTSEYIFNIVYNDDKLKMTVFIGKAGIESFIDLNTLDDKSIISPYEISYLDLEIREYSSLAQIEKDFLKASKIKATKEIIWANYFERGSFNPTIKNSDLDNLDEICEVLIDILRDKEEQKKLEASDMFLLYLNRKELMYSFFETNETMFIPKLKYARPKANSEIVLELNKLNKTEDKMHLSLKFTANFIHNKYPLSIFSYGKMNEPLLDALLVDCEASMRKQVIWSYLLAMFEANGLPEELEINDLEIFNFLEKTLRAVGVKLTYSRKDVYINSYLDDLEMALISYSQNAKPEEKADLKDYQSFLNTANTFLKMVSLDGYDPTTQRLVDDLKDFYDLIINYLDDTNDSDSNYIDYDNNLVS